MAGTEFNDVPKDVKMLIYQKLPLAQRLSGLEAHRGWLQDELLDGAYQPLIDVKFGLDYFKHLNRIDCSDWFGTLNINFNLDFGKVNVTMPRWKNETDMRIMTSTDLSFADDIDYMWQMSATLYRIEENQEKDPWYPWYHRKSLAAKSRAHATPYTVLCDDAFRATFDGPVGPLGNGRYQIEVNMRGLDKHPESCQTMCTPLTNSKQKLWYPTTSDERVQQDAFKLLYNAVVLIYRTHLDLDLPSVELFEGAPPTFFDAVNESELGPMSFRDLIVRIQPNDTFAAVDADPMDGKKYYLTPLESLRSCCRFHIEENDTIVLSWLMNGWGFEFRILGNRTEVVAIRYDLHDFWQKTPSEDADPDVEQQLAVVMHWIWLAFNIHPNTYKLHLHGYEEDEEEDEQEDDDDDVEGYIGQDGEDAHDEGIDIDEDVGEVLKDEDEEGDEVTGTDKDEMTSVREFLMSELFSRTREPEKNIYTKVYLGQYQDDAKRAGRAYFRGTDNYVVSLGNIEIDADLYKRHIVKYKLLCLQHQEDQDPLSATTAHEVLEYAISYELETSARGVLANMSETPNYPLSGVPVPVSQNDIDSTETIPEEHCGQVYLEIMFDGIPLLDDCETRCLKGDEDTLHQLWHPNTEAEHVQYEAFKTLCRMMQTDLWHNYTIDMSTIGLFTEAPPTLLASKDDREDHNDVRISLMELSNRVHVDDTYASVIAEPRDGKKYYFTSMETMQSGYLIFIQEDDAITVSFIFCGHEYRLVISGDRTSVNCFFPPKGSIIEPKDSLEWAALMHWIWSTFNIHPEAYVWSVFDNTDNSHAGMKEETHRVEIDLTGVLNGKIHSEDRMTEDDAYLEDEDGRTEMERFKFVLLDRALKIFQSYQDNMPVVLGAGPPTNPIIHWCWGVGMAAATLVLSILPR